jgi:TPR repeat protein
MFKLKKNQKNKVDVLEGRLRDIKVMINAGAVDKVQEILEFTSNEFPESSSPLTYIRARMYEEGLFGKLDINSAIKYFSFLTQGNDIFVGEAMVGIARMLYKEDPVANSDNAIDHCMRAVELESNAMAMMLLAAVYEDTKKDFKSAKMWALRAFRSRSPWGLRYMAVLFYRRKKYISGILYELAVLLAKPFMLRRYEVRGPFK